MRNRKFNLAIKVWLTATYMLIFIPIFVIIMMSFNETRFGMLPFIFTTRWYVMLFEESNLFPATLLSLELSGTVALTSMFIGTLTALGAQYVPKKVSDALMGVAQLPIIIPWLVQAIALLLLFNLTGLGRSYMGMYLGNLIVVLPYCIMMVLARFNEADRTPEDAARTLGASYPRVFKDVIFPMLVPGIISGGLMSFVVCFNAFAMQFFLAPFGVRTLPMEIFTLIRVGYEPDMNALASIIMTVTIVLVVMLNKLGYSANRLMKSK
ncbi:spermidine/putrescine transport system permease protein [Dethiosulfatibacter aminovorans DSM 17477]|uniref:Spermidine/putrescine transport system permease protein n=1 Tax=Dethiosulfatibacter aminovorans DSM 17477 TaxID=1121476 RepID=A0A1M6IXF3_9FIRM|nr:ABC transporter permease [Dethiosulfatibacter aminovorans]SHJ39123.1 spermidine/putrescine transport system permease protein [Dethiosulfatibacter aminovorans DSM 17477]